MSVRVARWFARRPDDDGVGVCPVLRGVTGVLAGREWPVGPEGQVVGRDPRECTVLVPDTADEISRRHCTVRWDPAERRFVVTDDGSTNGTYVGDGRRLTEGAPLALAPGSRLFLGTRTQQVVLELRRSATTT